MVRHLLENSDWLKDELDKFGEDDYVLLDCPGQKKKSLIVFKTSSMKILSYLFLFHYTGQIDLYSHLPIMHNLVQLMLMWGYRLVSVYLLDALFVLEPSKFISGCMLSLSCMLQLELPHINVITKMDLADKEEVETVLNSEGARMVNKKI